MLISTVVSHEVYTEVTLETLTAVVCATVRDWHCRRCGELNRYDGLDDAVVSVSRDFVVVPPQDRGLLGDGVCWGDDNAVRVRHARQSLRYPARR
jgi:hypothetical protein